MAGTHGDQVPEMVTGVVIIDFPMAMGSAVVEADMAMAADAVVVVVVVVVVIGVDRDRKEGDIKFKFIIFHSTKLPVSFRNILVDLKTISEIIIYKNNFLEWDDGRKKGSTLPL